jgi:hypothetical protein
MLPISVAPTPVSPGDAPSRGLIPATRSAKYRYEQLSKVESAVNESRRTWWSGGEGTATSGGSSGAGAGTA